jgi:O-antigen/teichoic acid export membrane protein
MASFFSRLKAYRRHIGGAAWTGIDQLLSSLSNFVISLAIARSGGAEALGLYTVAFAIYLMIFGFQRALISEPLLTIPPEHRKRQDDHSRFALGSAVVYLIPVSLIVLIVGLATGSAPIVVLSVSLPLLCLQDLYRHLFFRQRRPELAALLDGIWVAVSLGGWFVVSQSGSAAVAVGVWSVGGALGAFMGAAASRTLPAGPRRSFRWWMREARALGGFLGVDRVLQKIFAQATTLGLAAVLGAADLGRLRGAEIILGPVGLILTAFQVFILPRLATTKSKLTRRTAMIISTASGGTTLLGTAFLWGLAPWLLPLVYGDSLELPTVLVLAVGVRMTIRALALGPVLQLKALQRGGPIAGTRAVTGSLGVLAILGVAALFGLVPAVWAQSLPALAFVVTLFVLLTRRPESSERGAEKTAVTADEDRELQD